MDTDSHTVRLTVTVCILFCSWWECAWVHYRGKSRRGDSMTDGWLKLVLSKRFQLDQWEAAPLKGKASQWFAWGGRVHSNQFKKYLFYPPGEMKFPLWLYAPGSPVCCLWTWCTEFYCCKLDRFSVSQWIQRKKVCKIFYFLYKKPFNAIQLKLIIVSKFKRIMWSCSMVSISKLPPLYSKKK